MDTLQTKVDKNKSRENIPDAFGKELRRKRIVRKSFADFVDTRDWDIYFTTTLRAPVKTITIVQNGRSRDVIAWRNDTASVRKELQCFFANLNRYSTFFTKYILLLAIFERQHKGARIHVHALIEGIPPKFCYALRSLACDFFGESKIEPYDPKRRARYYFGDKFTNPDLCDFDFMKINSRVRRRPVVEWPIPLKDEQALPK